MRLDLQTSPRLVNLLSGYSPDAEFGYLDPDCPPESAPFWWPDEALNELLAEAETARATLATLDDDAAALFLGGFTALPAGRTWHAWFDYLIEHITEFYPHRKPQTIGSDGVRLPRASRFLDKDAGNAAATDVLRANESRLRAWSDGHDGTTRLHLYADLGRTVGTYLEQSEVESFQRSGKDPALQPPRHEATGCVVLMRRHHETGAPYVATAYPDLALPGGARERYPDLPLLFGGYFGQDYPALDTHRWSAERNVNISTRPAVRERVEAQLVDLLREDDEDLRRSVEALGSYVMPRALRRWVTGLHRRMTRLQW